MIVIDREYTMPPNDIQKVAHSIALDMLSEYGINSVWKSATYLVFECNSGAASGVKGNIEIFVTPVKKIEIKVKLPFLLSALQGEIQKQINETLNKKVY